VGNWHHRNKQTKIKKNLCASTAFTQANRDVEYPYGSKLMEARQRTTDMMVEERVNCAVTKFAETLCASTAFKPKPTGMFDPYGSKLMEARRRTMQKQQ
jgi:hypothetical protein